MVDSRWIECLIRALIAPSSSSFGQIYERISLVTIDPRKSHIFQKTKVVILYIPFTVGDLRGALLRLWVLPPLPPPSPSLCASDGEVVCAAQRVRERLWKAMVFFSSACPFDNQSSTKRTWFCGFLRLIEVPGRLRIPPCSLQKRARKYTRPNARAHTHTHIHVESALSQRCVKGMRTNKK